MSEKDWVTEISKWPKKMVRQNSKLALTDFHQWSIPALTASVVDGTGTKVVSTCPGAGECAGFCYAQQGGYGFKGTMVAHTRNLQAYKRDSDRWAAQLTREIKAKQKIKAFRIHDSGDFFNSVYLRKWMDIVRAVPEVQFYAYTKVIPLVRSLESEGGVPENMTFILSYGGKWDDQIDTDKDRHSKVFTSNGAMEKAGYFDTTKSDANAADPTKLKIGLVYHGNQAYAGSAV